MNYNTIYQNKNVWGIEPNKLLLKIFSLEKFEKTGEYFLDLGCGQGRDSLFMAEKGFNIVAVDISNEGIKKIEEYLTQHENLKNRVKLICQDINSFNIEENKYKIINAFNSLQFLTKQGALDIIKKVKNGLITNGYIVISGFTTNDPSYQKTINQNKGFFEPIELKNLFANFKIIFYEEKILDDIGHPGFPAPHQHGVVKMIAQKI
jgi:tellurite methyltransferase